MSLNSILSVAASALSAQETAIQVTDNNIANAETPGYTRETVALTATSPTQTANGEELGTGVDAASIQSVRASLLTLGIQQQSSGQTSAAAQENALTDVQSLFPDSGSSIGTAMSTFFTSLSALSNAPSSTADRQTVLSDAGNVAQAFNTVSNGLSTAQTSLNSEISGDVTQINEITQQIAALNPQIAAANAQGGNAGSIQDQQSQLELQLSQLTSISVTSTAQGDTITTGNGSALVVGDQSYALRTTTNSSAMTQVLDSNGQNITKDISGGDMGGAITARDITIAGIASQVDTLAYQFATAINTAQSAGYDQNGNAGTALFAVPSTSAGAAASIAVSATEPSAIAASSDSSSGSNGNVANLTAVQMSALPSGSDPTDAYADIVDQLGNAVSDASTESSALTTSLSQLTSEQGSISGVSTDEESTNLISYQQAYEAAAEIVTTVNTLFTVTLEMVGITGG
jgi:flagellar hook-associated protein 1 FlgK